VTIPEPIVAIESLASNGDQIGKDIPVGRTFQLIWLAFK
jgi:hypothetical protein